MISPSCSQEKAQLECRLQSPDRKVTAPSQSSSPVLLRGCGMMGKGHAWARRGLEVWGLFLHACLLEHSDCSPWRHCSNSQSRPVLTNLSCTPISKGFQYLSPPSSMLKVLCHFLVINSLISYILINSKFKKYCEQCQLEIHISNQSC